MDATNRDDWANQRQPCQTCHPLCHVVSEAMRRLAASLAVGRPSGHRHDLIGGVFAVLTEEQSGPTDHAFTAPVLIRSSTTALCFLALRFCAGPSHQSNVITQGAPDFSNCLAYRLLPENKSRAPVHAGFHLGFHLSAGRRINHEIGNSESKK